MGVGVGVRACAQTHALARASERVLCVSCGRAARVRKAGAMCPASLLPLSLSRLMTKVLAGCRAAPEECENALTPGITTTHSNPKARIMPLDRISAGNMEMRMKLLIDQA